MLINIALHENLGFDYIYHADTDPEIDELSRDRQAFNKMFADIKNNIESNIPYVAVLLPQIGHAPWPEKPPEISVKEYGKKKAIQHDMWLSELISLLEKTQKLDHTTIVVSSDHGIRTKHEDPEFRTGFIDEYSYKVPLMIFSTASFKQREYITRKTSHIDVVPTLLGVHDIERDRTYEQGLPV